MTTPYYADESVTLYHGDCREVSAWLEADVLVTDPPYGIGWRQGSYLGSHAGGKKRETHAGIHNDNDTAVRDAALASWGESPGLVFGAPMLPAPIAAHRVLVWQKPRSAGLLGASTWRRDWEAIYVVGQWPQLPATRSSVLQSRATNHTQYGGDHPHSKPLDLLEQLIQTCPPGVVADPFAGGGSALVAARNSGRRAIGVELDERYCEVIAKRLAQGAFDFGGVA